MILQHLARTPSSVISPSSVSEKVSFRTMIKICRRVIGGGLGDVPLLLFHHEIFPIRHAVEESFKIPIRCPGHIDSDQDRSSGL